MSYAKKGQKISLVNRELICKYGPQDIDVMYKNLDGVPETIKEVYEER